MKEIVARNVEKLLGLQQEQGWLSGESIRLSPVWSGFDSRKRRAFVVDSRPRS